MNGSADPPVVLVKTWIALLLSSEDKEVKERATEMLLNAFGDMKSVADFAQKHQIKLK